MILNASLHISKSKIVSVFLAFFIILFTYKSFEPDLAPGLDSSYVWALNYLFENNLNFMDKLVYPLGPLGFLLMPAPIGNNLYYATFFKVILQLIFIYQMLNYKRDNNHWWLSSLLALITSWFATLDVLMIGISFFLLISENKVTSKYRFICIATFSFLALLIKSSIGIAIHGMVMFYMLHQLIKLENRKNAISSMLLYLATYTLCNMVYFRDFAEAFQFNRNAIRLASSYGDAMVLFPEHNAFFIWTSLIITYFSLFYKNGNIKTAVVLLFPVFTMWKHSMVREDFYHARLFLQFLPFIFGILLLQSNKKLVIAIAWILASFLYYQNLKTYTNFKPFKFDQNRAKDFYHSVINIHSFNETNARLSAENLKSNKLNDDIRQIIGNKTVDVHPYELSYIPANGLNWKPRITLQSGAFASWLDKINAAEYDKEDKPEFIIWHLNSDESGSNNVTFDNRTALNDDALTTLSIFKNYNIRYKSPKLILLEKRAEPNKINSQATSSFALKFNEWFAVKLDTVSYTKLHLNYNPPLKSNIRKFLYKGNEFQVDYKLKSGITISKRFVMDNAKDGLWINPYIIRIDSCVVSDNVEKIRIKSRMHEAGDLTGYFEYFKMNHDFFECKNQSAGKEIFRDSFLLLNQNEHKVNAQGYSKTWNINVDSIWTEGFDSISVLAACQIRSQCNGGINLVISFENGDAMTWFKVSPYVCNALDKSISLQRSIAKNTFPKGIIKVFVWNTSAVPIEIEEMSLNIQSIK